MLRHKTTAIFCYGLAVLVPGTLWAQDSPAGGAVVSPSGTVSVNSSIVSGSSTLFGNEKISTGPKSAAELSAPGTHVVIAEQTSAEYSVDSIHLSSGTITIASSNGVYAQVGQQKIVPANRAILTKFRVQSAGCDVLVDAISQDLTLPDGKVLQEGKSARLLDKDCAAAVAPTTALGGHRIPAAIWWVGAAAAGAAGVALLNSGGSTPVSPSRP